ncbi:MAG: hypothetical protein OEZ06_24555 [Myxococcales bacterium]|nr:hypothetical protein [Myxococcales bacterium]
MRRRAAVGGRARSGGGDAHGTTSQLSPEQLDHLVAHMKSL